LEKKKGQGGEKILKFVLKGSKGGGGQKRGIMQEMLGETKGVCWKEPLRVRKGPKGHSFRAKGKGRGVERGGRGGGAQETGQGEK